MRKPIGFLLSDRSKRLLGGQRGWCKAEQRRSGLRARRGGALEARGGKRRLGFLLPSFG
ncbi:hypothetical protein V6Z11_A02G192000 [Gossypium hirsutum]